MHGKDGHRKTLQDKWAKKYHCHLQNTFSTPALHRCSVFFETDNGSHFLKRSKIHMLIKKRQSGLPLRLIDSKTRSEYRRHKTAAILTGYDCPVPTSCTTTVHILTSLVHLFSDMIFYKEYFNRWKYSPINGSIIPHLKEFSQY